MLADHTKTDAKKIEELRRSEILKAGRVFSMAEFALKSEADIEDLFEPDVFVEIVNSAYNLRSKLALTVQSLADADAKTERQAKKAEAAFRVMPESIPEYDHFTPAAWLIRNLSKLDEDSPAMEATLDRAENLFKTLNAALDT